MTDYTCLSTCPPGFKGQWCYEACPEGSFGSDCKGDCTSRCVNNKCDSRLGYCLMGCKPGLVGPFCLETCQNYKPTGPCPFCGHCKDSVCAGSGGDCYYECPREWEGDVCQDCQSGRWGLRCESTCPTNCLSSCGKMLGYCDSCKTGKHGDYCDSLCPVNCRRSGCDQYNSNCKMCDGEYYGPSCEKQCGKCSAYSCDIATGECQSCQAGFYTKLCNETCPVGCADDGCEMNTGSCSYCQPGLYGPRCESKCPESCGRGECDKQSGACDSCVLGKHGRYCNMTCGHCSAGQCNQDNGHCFPCNRGYHGDTCDKPCPGNCNSSSCDQNSGMCYSCESGYYGPFCTARCQKCSSGHCDFKNGTCTPCNPGYFGPTCNTRCNETCLDAGCDQVSGECIGCHNGWYGATCELACPVNCIRGVCDQFTGECGASGCKASFFGARCDQECPGCLEGACDTNNGVCVYGCRDGKTGALCNEVCPPGTFGGNCSLVCHCAAAATCDVVSGHCDAGCEEGWTGDDCQMAVSQVAGPVPEVVYIAAIVAGGILIILVTITVVIGILVRRKRRKKADESHNLESNDNVFTDISLDNEPRSNISTGHGPYVEVDTPPIGEDVHYENAQGLKNRSRLDENSIPNSGFSELLHKTRASSDVSYMNNKHGVAQVSPVINKSTIKPSVAVKPPLVKSPHTSVRASECPPIPQKPDINFKTKKISALSNKDRDTIFEASQDGAETPDHKQYDEEYEENPYGCVKNDTSLGSKVEVEKLGAYLKDLEDSNGFLKEYEKLNHNKQAPWRVASNPKLKTKNRYRGIIAYDHSRVVLSQIDDDPLTDYINANYIPSYTKNHAYIASQGVTKHNYDDFWRMIMEKGITTIVMLTNLIEGNTIKCLQYWPSKGSITVGNVKVSLVSESLRADCVIRVLKAESTRIMRTVTQYHYTDWPDHNVPVSPRQLVNLRWRVKRQTEGSTAPVLVHCSAGIGRTGTFLAVDRLLDEAVAASVVDVPTAVNTLRQNRINMVQNVHQYEFVYRAVLEALTVGRSTVHVDEFATYVQNLREDQVKAQFDYVMKNSEVVLQDSNEGPEIKIPHLKSAIKCLNCPSATEVYTFWEKIRLSRSKHVLYCSSKEDSTQKWLPSHQHPVRLSEVTVRIAKDCSKSKRYCDIEIEPNYYNVQLNPKDHAERSEYMNCGGVIEILDDSHRLKFYHVKCDLDELREIHKRIQGFANKDQILMIRDNDNSIVGVCIMTLLLMEQADVHQEVEVMDTAIAVQQALPGALKSVKSYKELLDATSSMLTSDMLTRHHFS